MSLSCFANQTSAITVTQSVSYYNLAEDSRKFHVIGGTSVLLSEPSIPPDLLFSYVPLNEKSAPSEKLCLRQWTSLERIMKNEQSTCPSEEIELDPSQSLQRRIDSMGWNEKLYLYPARPIKDNPIKKEQAENWINAHCLNQRRVARKFLDLTRYVTQEEFETSLQASVRKFNEWIKTLPSKDYVLLVTYKTREKSNRWVAEIALPFLEVLPKQVFAYDSFSAVTGNLKKYLAVKETDLIVFFDDAVYSGEQSKNTLFSLQSILNRKKFAHIVPFITDYGKANVEELNKKMSGHLRGTSEIAKSVFLFYDQNLKSLEEFMSPLECSLLRTHVSGQPIYSSRPCKQPAVYFQHKIADWVSTYESAYKIGQPFSKTEDCLENQSIKVEDTRFIEDLRPPYKSRRAE